jgi:ribose transport system substrate-binding protein
MARILTLLTLVAVLVAGAFGCGGQTSRKTTIAVVPKGTTNEFWKSVHAGAIKAGREFGVEILWQGPLREDDREDQIKIIDTLVNRGIDGLVLAPLDEKALRQPVSNAVRAGIPVVIVDSRLDSEEPVSLVSTSNLLAGQMAGQHLAKVMGGKGNVIMMRLHEGSASTTAREQGFLDAVAAFPGITVISSNQYAGPSTEGAYRTGENLLASNKAAQGNVQGIFTPNESTTFGMLRVLEDARLTGRIRLVGFDSSDKLVQGLRAGAIDGLVLQNPFGMGYLGVKTLVRAMRGERVETIIDTGVVVVTRENMDTPEIKDRLQPNLDAYLK